MYIILEPTISHLAMYRFLDYGVVAVDGQTRQYSQFQFGNDWKLTKQYGNLQSCSVPHILVTRRTSCGYTFC